MEGWRRPAGAVAVKRAVAEAGRHGPVSVASAKLASFPDAEHEGAIDRDVDKAIWEGLEAGMHHQGRVTPNYLALMALGGALAGAGLLATGKPAVQATTAITAAVIAPGFEPLAKA